VVSAPGSTASPELLLEEIRRCCTRPWTLMEVCGGQTHALLRHGIDQLLPPELTLIHGPGCPVCVTASERIDQALELAAQPEVILCSFGDMLRVPGSQGGNLLDRRAAGADVRVVYSPLDVLELARRQPERLVVFFAVGFETTAPSTALLAQRALTEGLTNLALLVSHVLVPPVLEVMLSNPECRVQGVLAAGHVCTVMGEQAYGQLVERHRRPIVVTGFEANELLLGILHCVRQLERGEQRLENVYRRAVRQRGNGSARALIEAVFQPEDAPWRGFGTIPQGGLRLRPPYDALAIGRSRMAATTPAAGPHLCLSGQVLQGLLKPPDCPSFNRACTPATPLGAPMVSSEGACAAYHRYRTLA
jgi:hydrogenase expression/formation protein HypD